MENLRENFLKLKEGLEQEAEVNFKKSRMIVTGLKEEILQSKVDPSTKCCKTAMANAVL